MVSEEHDASSNSPNGRLTVTDAHPATGDGASAVRGIGRARTGVVLSDGSSFFVRTDLWEGYGRVVGDEVALGDLEQLEFRTQVSAAYAYSLDRLASREHSRRQLRDKLRGRSFPDAVINATLDKLAEQGYQSDRRFAKTYVEQRLRRHPEAPGVIRARLLSRGVDDATALEAIIAAREEDPDLFAGALRAAARKLSRRSGMTDAKLARALARRGFGSSEIMDLIRALGRHGEIF